MTLAEFARLLAFCTACGRRGGHRAVLDVIECDCGFAWHAAVPLCFDAKPASLPALRSAVPAMDAPQVLERVA